MRLIAILVATLPAVVSWGQTTREIMLADSLKCAGLYIPYPDCIDEPTPVPSGYIPFYVSHYGRHGSRYLGDDNDYFRVYDELNAAEQSGSLTSRGKDLFHRVTRIWDDARGRGGQLAPLGYRQHRDIASRLLKECGPVFDDSARVTAVSTVFMRCAHSMFAFVDRIRQYNPALDVSMESSERNMNVLSHLNVDAIAFNKDNPVKSKQEEFRNRKIVPTRFTSSIFKDVSALRVPARDFMWWVYLVAIDLPNLETGESLFDFFTSEELFDLWQVFNYDYYTCHSVNPDNEGVFIESAKPLLADFLDCADGYISRGEHGATLRFGHDSSVIPLAGLLRFPVAAGRESDPSCLYKVYADYRVSPMASNIQMRLYRSSDGRDIIVKFMLNEQEMPLPDTVTDIFPYYRWEDARATLCRLLDTPYR